jgi:Ca2+-binding EF-hand superfamily protein
VARLAGCSDVGKMLTKARLDEMKAQFALFDTDLSGTIERDECVRRSTAQCTRVHIHACAWVTGCY